MSAANKFFGAEPTLAPECTPKHAEIIHSYARPEGERIRTFLHDLQTQFSCTLEVITPLDTYKTETDYEVCDMCEKNKSIHQCLLFSIHGEILCSGIFLGGWQFFFCVPCFVS
jgi:hypothetical protein